MKYKKLKEQINVDDFWYDLFVGGYIKPEKLLVDEFDINKVQEAIELIKDFEQGLIDNDMINQC
jgi:hypothetical protein